MKKIIFAMMFIVALGCGQSQQVEQRQSQQSEPAYMDVLQVYNTELEILDRLETALSRHITDYEKTIDRIYDSSLSVEATEKKADEITGPFKTKRLEIEQEIAAQQVRVDRAKAELDAAEAKRD